MTGKSPLAPKEFPAMPAVDGVRLAVARSGVKYRGRDDLLLAEVADGATVAGVLTQSNVVGAPVKWCRQRLATPLPSPRAVIINAGNANVGTGANGRRHVLETCEAVAANLKCAPEQIFAASTGVIGEPLLVKKIVDAVPEMVARLAADGWQNAAAAIGTTDTFAKGATARATVGGHTVTLNGIAKGSGMIEPNMATLLVFLFTDAAVAQPALQSLLAAANETSFNAITVDGDASTSDTCLLFATGAAGNECIHNAADENADDFRRALSAVMTDLAVQVVRDGEGARKLIIVDVRGAQDDAAAKTVAKSVANSPLVKTAIAGADANWGRILMAVGKANARVDASRLDIALGGIPVAVAGQRADAFDEKKINAHFKGDEIHIEINLNLDGADGRARVWSCDLTHDYITINADYRS